MERGADSPAAAPANDNSSNLDLEEAYQGKI
jgi:hypothetical protein